MNQARSQRSELYKTKKHKDYSFLQHIKQEKLSQHITKYLLKEGSSQVVGQIKAPLTLYYSYQKFDYAGKLVDRINNKSLCLPYTPKQNMREQHNICHCLSSMKLNQNSWFNIQQYQKFDTKCSGYHGYHYEVIIDKFSFKNDNTFESKKLVYLQNKQKGKELFLKKHYKEAIKVYRNSINILTGLSKKIFAAQQLIVLNDFAEKSQANFLKCLAKINGFGGRYDKDIGKLGKQLSQKFVKKYPQSPNSFYQKAIYLKYQNRFGDAQEAIKEGLRQKFSGIVQQVTKQKNTLKNMLQEIKKTKQRNVRHLQRVQIRRKKVLKRNNDVWDDDEKQDFQK